MIKNDWVNKEELTLHHGTSTSWFDNGKKESVDHSKWNILHGKFWEWDEEGHLILEGEILYGIPVWSKRYDDDGEIIEDYKVENHPERVERFRRLKIHFESIWALNN